MVYNSSCDEWVLPKIFSNSGHQSSSPQLKIAIDVDGVIKSGIGKDDQQVPKGRLNSLSLVSLVIAVGITTLYSMYISP